VKEWFGMNALFTFELLLVVVVIVVVIGALYIAVTNRRKRRETGRRVGTADVPVGVAPDEPAGGVTEEAVSREGSREPWREFYKSMGLETAEDMKVRVYSIEEYRGTSWTGPAPDRPPASWPH
jgi:hypothetical protein